MEHAQRRWTDSNLFWTGLAALVMLLACGGVAAGLLAVPMPITVAVVLAVIGAGAILYNPYVGAMLFLTLLYVRVEQFVPQLEVLRLPLLVALFTLFSWLIRVLRKQETFQYRGELGWVIAFMFAIVFSAYRVQSINTIIQCLLDAARLALLFFLFQQLFNTEKRAAPALQWLLVLTVGLAAIGIYGYVTETNVLLEHGLKRAIVPAGKFDDPNDLAAVLVIGVPLALRLLLRKHSLLTRLWGAAALVTLVVCIFFCNSRGGMLALAMGVSVFLVYHIGWTRGATLGLAALLVVLFFGPDRFSPKTVEGDDSTMGRILAWQDGLRYFEHNPLVGVGYKQFEVRHGIPAHNSFVHGLSEGGLLTATTWVGVNYWAILTLVRMRRKREDEEEASADGGESAKGREWRDYAAALLAGLMASLTAGMFLSHTYREVPLIPVALAAGMACFRLRGVRKPDNLPHYLAIPAIVVAGIGIIYFIVLKAL